MSAERVYARILARVDRDELRGTCQETTRRDTSAVERRVRAAQRALQHAFDVQAAWHKVPELVGLSGPPTTTTTAMALVAELEELHVALKARMRQLAALASPVVHHGGNDASTGEAAQPVIPPSPEPEPQHDHYALNVMNEEEEPPTPTNRRGKRRRLRQDSVDSPRKPPRPGRFSIAEDGDDDDDTTTEGEEDEAFPVQSRQQSSSEPRGGPHEMPSVTEDEETEDDLPMELDVLDSDTEFEMARYLDKARRLRKISSERRMSELPALIRAVLAELDRHEWPTMPRELLGTLSATLGASTTVKPTQRTQLHAELQALQTIALRIDETTARRYPTLIGSRARFLSSMDHVGAVDQDAPPSPHAAEDTRSALIEDLHAATTALAQRDPAELKSMEQIDELLTVVDRVFDNPTLARSRRYRASVEASLDVLAAYVGAIPRTTRRSLRTLESLQRRRAQLSGFEV